MIECHMLQITGHRVSGQTCRVSQQWSRVHQSIVQYRGACRALVHRDRCVRLLQGGMHCVTGLAVEQLHILEYKRVLVDLDVDWKQLRDRTLHHFANRMDRAPPLDQYRAQCQRDRGRRDRQHRMRDCSMDGYWYMVVYRSMGIDLVGGKWFDTSDDCTTGACRNGPHRRV